MSEQLELPVGWTVLPLHGVASIVRGITFASADKVAEGTQGAVPCLRTSNVQETLKTDDLLWVSREFVRRDDQWLQKGDTIISMANSYQLVGKVSFNPGQAVPMSFGGFIAAIRSSTVDPKFLFYVLKSPGVQTAIRKGASQTVNIANISAASLKAIEVPVPPTAEQHRIVAEVETQFTRLDAAVSMLQRVKANLKRARASVLKAAVEGRLVPTEASLARVQGRTYEPATVLLARILDQRKARWPKGKEPVSPKMSVLRAQALPSGWHWASFDQVGSVLLGRQRAPQFLTGKHFRPYLRVANIKDDRIELADVEQMDFDATHFAKYRLEVGDILISEGQSPELVGQSAIYRGGPDGLCFQKTLHRFRPVPPGPSSEFVQIVLRAWVKNEVFKRMAPITTNIAHLTLARLLETPFPLPPEHEQLRIVAEVERRLSVLDKLDETVELNLARCTRLRQSILKRAFAGKLVPQDPDDEPASVLLDPVLRQVSRAV